MNPEPCKVVCFSKGRSDTIGEQTLKLFPHMYLVVDEAERGDYEGLVPDDHLFTHPGLYPPIRICNFILDHPLLGAGDVAMIGDDTTDCFAMPGWTARRYNDPEVCEAVVQNAAENAREMGAGVFGFAANSNPIIYEPYRPIHLTRWVASPFGFTKGHGLRFDERLTVMSDVDLCLQSLMKHRILWCDRRWTFVARALTNKGGNASIRSPELYERERKLLKEKWGHYIRFDTQALHSSKRYKQGLPSTTMMTYVYVPRTQPMF